MTNLYAPPRATVRDVVDPNAQLVLAERGSRLGAEILDIIIFGSMVYLPFLVLGVAGAAAASSTEGNTGGGMMALGLTLSLIGFVVWFGMTLNYLRRNGQSIGKKIVGVKIVRKDGTRASVGRIILLRNLVIRLVSLVPLFTFVDALFIFSESRQCLHDRLADTIVIVA
jgi:uncharacterized RDD family membrane protein YckC